MNSIELITQYDALVSKIGEDIKKSSYKTQFFMDLLNLKRGFFYKKIKEKKFTSEEVKTLSKYLYPKENEAYEMELISKLLEKSKQEIVTGNYRDFDVLLKESKEKYGL